MSTSYSSRLGLGTPASGDRSWDVPLAADLALLEGLSPIGALAVRLHEIPSTSLNVAVAAGTFINSSGAYVAYAGTASQAIAASSTKYVWLSDTGTLTIGTAFPTSGTKHVRLAVVVTGASTVTSITDSRIAFVSAG